MSPPPPEVLCVGHAAFDLSLFLAEYPAENSKAEVAELTEAGGGPAANAAYLLGRWGVRSAFAGLSGDDARGRDLREEFGRAGVDVALFELRAGHPTPFSVILVNRGSGSRTIINRKAPGARFRLDGALLGRWAPRVLLFDGHEPEASFQALEAFPEAFSILDAGSVRDGTLRLAGEVDCLAASERFARQAARLSDLASEERAREALTFLQSRFEAPQTVVTLGERGLVADDGTGRHRLPAFPATAVDTTAAGDIFHGALAFAALRSWEFRAGLRFASMAASLSVRRHGGRPSMPALAEVEEALAHVE